jgi:hypothetical protein
MRILHVLTVSSRENVGFGRGVAESLESGYSWVGSFSLELIILRCLDGSVGAGAAWG